MNIKNIDIEKLLNIKFKANIIERIKELNKKLNNAGIISTDDLYKKGKSYVDKLLKEFQDIVIKPKNKEELQTLIKGNYPLLLIDVSNIFDFKKLFYRTKSEISWKNPLNMITFWNMENAITCEEMFSFSNFNQPIEWDLKNCKNMSYIFYQNCSLIFDKKRII